MISLASQSTILTGAVNTPQLLQEENVVSYEVSFDDYLKIDTKRYDVNSEARSKISSANGLSIWYNEDSRVAYLEKLLGEEDNKNGEHYFRYLRLFLVKSFGDKVDAASLKGYSASCQDLALRSDLDFKLKLHRSVFFLRCNIAACYVLFCQGVADFLLFVCVSRTV